MTKKNSTTRERLIRLEEKMDNHLAHHEKTENDWVDFRNWVIYPLIVSGVISSFGVVFLVIRSYVSG